MAIEVNIRILRSTVLEEVRKTTAYIGSKAISAEDPGAFGRVAAVEANDEQLDRYFSEACADAKLAMVHWIIYANWQTVPRPSDTDYLSILLKLPDNWEKSLESAVREQLLSHLVNGVVWRWLLQTKKEDAQAYAAQSQAAMLAIKQILLTRRRPTRRAAPSGDDDTPDGLWHDEGVWLDAATWNENN